MRFQEYSSGQARICISIYSVCLVVVKKEERLCFTFIEIIEDYDHHHDHYHNQQTRNLKIAF